MTTNNTADWILMTLEELAAAQECGERIRVGDVYRTGDIEYRIVAIDGDGVHARIEERA